MHELRELFDSRLGREHTIRPSYNDGLLEASLSNFP